MTSQSLLYSRKVKKTFEASESVEFVENTSEKIVDLLTPPGFWNPRFVETRPSQHVTTQIDYRFCQEPETMLENIEMEVIEGSPSTSFKRKRNNRFAKVKYQIDEDNGKKDLMRTVTETPNNIGFEQSQQCSEELFQDTLAEDDTEMQPNQQHYFNEIEKMKEVAQMDTDSDDEEAVFCNKKLRTTEECDQQNATHSTLHMRRNLVNTLPLREVYLNRDCMNQQAFLMSRTVPSNRREFKNNTNELPKDKKKFPCLKCSKEFFTKQNMLRHLEAKVCEKKRVKVHECPVCGKVFNRPSKLANHLLKQHEKLQDEQSSDIPEISSQIQNHSNFDDHTLVELLIDETEQSVESNENPYEYVADPMEENLESNENPYEYVADPTEVYLESNENSYEYVGYPTKVYLESNEDPYEYVADPTEVYLQTNENPYEYGADPMEENLESNENPYEYVADPTEVYLESTEDSYEYVADPTEVYLQPHQYVGAQMEIDFEYNFKKPIIELSQQQVNETKKSLPVAKSEEAQTFFENGRKYKKVGLRSILICIEDGCLNYLFTKHHCRKHRPDRPDYRQKIFQNPSKIVLKRNPKLLEYQCDICSKVFNLKSSIYMHMKMMHSDPKNVEAKNIKQRNFRNKRKLDINDIIIKNGRRYKRLTGSQLCVIQNCTSNARAKETCIHHFNSGDASLLPKLPPKRSKCATKNVAVGTVKILENGVKKKFNTSEH